MDDHNAEWLNTTRKRNTMGPHPSWQHEQPHPDVDVRQAKGWKAIGHWSMNHVRVGKMPSGKSVYLKRVQHPDHTKNSIPAQKAYELFGVKAPKHHFNAKANEMASEGIEGRPLAEVGTLKNPDQAKHAAAVRLLMADWDGHDENWIVDKAGDVVPIDLDMAGGCFTPSMLQNPDKHKVLWNRLRSNTVNSGFMGRVPVEDIYRHAHELSKTPQYQQMVQMFDPKHHEAMEYVRRTIEQGVNQLQKLMKRLDDLLVDDLFKGWRGRKPSCKGCGQKYTRATEDHWRCDTTGCAHQGKHFNVKRNTGFKHEYRNEMESMLQDGDQEPQLPENIYALVDAKKGPMGWAQHGKLGEGTDPPRFYHSPEHIPSHIQHNGVGVVQIDSTKLPPMFHQGGGMWSTELDKLPEGAVTGFQTLRGTREGRPMQPFYKAADLFAAEGFILKTVELEVGPHMDPWFIHDEPVQKAISDIPAGKYVGESKNLKVFDYSHLLPEEYRNNGYKLLTSTSFNKTYPSIPGTSMAQLTTKDGFDINAPGTVHGNHIGSAAYRMSGVENQKTIQPHSYLAPEHHGKGIGSAMYEALYAHVKNEHGVTQVHGGWHSPAAKRVHERLAKKHGFKIHYKPSEYWTEEDKADADEGYHPPYQYELKSAPQPPEPWRKHPYANKTEAMPTDLVWNYREFDRAPGEEHSHVSPERWEKLKQDIATNGIHEPLIMGWHPQTGRAKLIEGNHRLAIARELGVTHLPVRMSRRSSPFDDGDYGHTAKDIPGHVIGSLTDQFGYTPADLPPSKVFTQHAHMFKAALVREEDKNEEWELMMKRLEALAKSIDELPKGEKTGDGKSYDYSHFLPAPYNKTHKLYVSDRMMTTRNRPTTTFATLTDPQTGTEHGHVRGNYYGYSHHEPYIEPHSELHEDFRGKGIGSAMYEALYKHAKDVHGIDKVDGSWHTPDADRVHRSLARKHGFNLVYQKLKSTGSSLPPYSYTLKSVDEVGPHMDPAFVFEEHSKHFSHDRILRG